MPPRPSLAAAPYAALARAAAAELGEGQELVLGETAGFLEPTARATGVPELIRGLPRGLVCSARVWSQHAYIGGTDPVGRVTRALDAPRLPAPSRDLDHRDRRRPGAGRALARPRDHERARRAAGCSTAGCVDWYENPRVTLAVQYTFREDDLFPTGLVTTDLKRARPALREWQAWGARPSARLATAANRLRVDPGRMGV